MTTSTSNSNVKSAYDIIRLPVITETSLAMAQNKKYVFYVQVNSSKTEIKKAVEEIFKVEVKDVNTIRVPGKKKRLGARPEGRTSERKKAVVTLTPESKTIEFFDGMM